MTNIGGTQRLGLYTNELKPGSQAHELYGKDEIQQRHRHRYEFNTDYRKQFEDAGMVFSGVSPDNSLMEIIELPENDFFMADQAHPEFQSRPNHSEPLYTGFVSAALKHHEANN